MVIRYCSERYIVKLFLLLQVFVIHMQITHKLKVKRCIIVEKNLKYIKID